MDDFEQISTSLEDASSQVVFLTTETYQGKYSAVLYETRTDALKKLNTMRKTSRGHIESCKGGFMTESGVKHRVLTPDEALSLDGKVVWYVSHKCFIPESYGRMDWINYFSTKEEAKNYFEERAGIYRDMVKDQSNIIVTSDDEQLLILVDKKPVVYLDYLAAPIGEILNEGTLTLDGLTSIISK